jgi:hypothetical protein
MLSFIPITKVQNNYELRKKEKNGELGEVGVMGKAQIANLRQRGCNNGILPLQFVFRN